MSYGEGFGSRPIDVWAPQIRELLVRLGDIAYVAGGAARELVLRNEAPAAEDVDLFLLDALAFDECCTRLLELGYQDAMESGYSATYRRNWVFELPVQVIKPQSDAWTLTFGSPEAVLAHFSFTTEQFAVTPWKHDGARAVVGDRAEIDTRSRLLKIANVTNPTHVALRAVKYAAKGYYMQAEEMEKVFAAAIERYAHG